MWEQSCGVRSHSLISASDNINKWRVVTVAHLHTWCWSPACSPGDMSIGDHWVRPGRAGHSRPGPRYRMSLPPGHSSQAHLARHRSHFDGHTLAREEHSHILTECDIKIIAQRNLKHNLTWSTVKHCLQITFNVLLFNKARL